MSAHRGAMTAYHDDRRRRSIDYDDKKHLNPSVKRAARWHLIEIIRSSGAVQVTMTVVPGCGFSISELVNV
jgi:hypothetical protein